jgi:hypothetical protein
MSEEKSRLVDAISRVLDAVNSTSLNDKEVNDAVRRVTSEHRTLQQGLMRLMVAIILEWAEFEKKGLFDLRNEACVKLARKFVDATEFNDRFMPFI